MKAAFLDSQRVEEPIRLKYSLTFGDVSEGEDVIVKDDYGRVEVAKNMGRYADEVGAQTGHRVDILLQP